MGITRIGRVRNCSEPAVGCKVVFFNCLCVTAIAWGGVSGNKHLIQGQVRIAKGSKDSMNFF